jgi:plasmid stabilization system protein ParE
MIPANVDFLPRAIDEAIAARRWYRRRSALLGSRFIQALDDAVQQISSSPALWPPYLLGTRVYRLRRFPYLVVYRELGATIQVIAVAHQRKKPGYWRRRIP